MEPLSATITNDPPGNKLLHRVLILSGILSSVVYIFANVVTVLLYEGYNPASQTVSELSAINSPTRSLWVSLLTLYSLLIIAFGWGVWQSGIQNRLLRIIGILFIVNAVIGFFWPPMHQREVLAAGGGTVTDTLHIVFTIVTVPLMIAIIGIGAAAFDKRFRIYSVLTLIVLIVAGIITGLDGPKISKNLPTPWIGIWERINIGVYILWVAVLAIFILQMERDRYKLLSKSS